MADLRRALRRRRAADLTVEPLVDVVAEFGTVVGDSVGKDYNVANSRAERFLRQYMAERVEMINGTTRKALHKALASEDPRGEVRRVFQDARNRRARMIAETECLPGDTLVDAAVVRAVFRRWYDGDMVEVITESGRKFSATPNHPMLTRRGWVGAGNLTEFDDLICDARQKDLIANVDVERRPAKLGEIFDAVAAVGITERKPSGGPDFHGDGRDGQIDVARTDRELRFGRFSPILKPLSQDLFAPSDRARAPLCGQCGRLLAINHRSRFWSGSDWIACRPQAPDHSRSVHSIALADRGRGHVLVIVSQLPHVEVFAEVGRMAAFCIEQSTTARTAAAWDAGALERGIDEAVIAPQDLCGSRSTQPPKIQFDRVTAVRFYRFVGHVYNLETPFGYFNLSGGAYTGNTVRASNWAAIDAGKWVGELSHKRWASQRDAEVRHDHTVMEGQIVRWNDPFIAPNGSKAHWPGGFAEPELSINCRCAALPSRANQRSDLGDFGDPVDLYENVRAPHVADMERAWKRVFREQEAAVLAELG